MSTEETMIDGPPETWAKTPHALVIDARVGASAVRMYGLLSMYHYRHMPATVGAFAADLGVDDRSIYRWLKELQACGWITYTPNPGQKGLGKRLVMHETPLTNLSGFTIQTSDKKIRGSDKKIRGSDKKIRGSDKIVGATPDLALPDAMKMTTQSPEESGRLSEEPTTPLPPTAPAPTGGGGGSDLSIVPSRTPSRTTEPPSNRTAGQSANTAEPDWPSSPPPPVAAAPSPPATRTPSRAPVEIDTSPGARLLAAEGFRITGIREFGHFPPEVLAPDIARMRAEGTEPGGMVLYWRQFPPGTTPKSEALSAAHNPRRSDDPLARERASVAATDAYLAEVRRQREVPRPVRETVGEARARRAREAAEAPPDAAPDAQ
jgi:hypothetical protein